MSDENLDWYYVTPDQQQGGPCVKSGLIPLYQNQTIDDATLVWHEQLPNWTAVSEVPGLLSYLKPTPEPIAKPAFPPNLFAGGMPALKPVQAAESTPEPAASPSASASNPLFAAVMARKQKMEQQPDANPDRLVGQLHEQVVQEEKKPETKAIPRPPEKKEGTSVNSEGWVELMSPDGIPYYFNQITKQTQWEKPLALRTEAEKDRVGDWVWMPDTNVAYIPAKVVSGYNDNKHHLETEDGVHHTVDKKIVLDKLVWSSLRTHVSDLVLLDEMSLPLILHALKTRFQKNEIYTNVGTILISLNPYKRLPLYTPAIIGDYHRRGNKNMPPHVFLIADDAFRQLLETGIPQSIVISGESGAGKTECTKQALQYLAEIAGSSTSNVEQKILASNPILEAFGNAKTVRNNNSSRFGKYVEINFDHNIQITGSTNTNYLLEKIRVVKQNKGERNYHAFYQLLRGATAQQRSQWKLEDVSKYWYLTQSGCDTVDDMDDVEEHEEVLKAMRELGWSQAEIDHVYCTVAGVLQLGNIKFVETGDRKCSIENPAAVDNTSALLQLDRQQFTKSVTTRVMRVTGQADIDVGLGKDEAEAARDALAKFIYEKLFDWIVIRINTAIGKGQVRTGPRGPTTIGILDIFGFEIFEHNQFEQLCINFTNEKLQQFFNQHTFKKEEELYRSEGISFEHVKYIDNQPVLDLIEMRPHGILPMVDEEIRMPRGSDKTFIQKLGQAQGKNTQYYRNYLKDPDMFIVEHYAGTVVYDSNGFLEKNRDRLNDDAYSCLRSSKFRFLVDLFDESGSANRATLGTKFAKQLNDLMIALNLTEPHYIRCVKPNPNKAELEFHPVLVLEQLRYSGVFEAVKIRKSGFPFRYTHTDFWKRFKCILPNSHPWGNDMVANCRKLIVEMKETEQSVQIGKTRILYRAEQHRSMELVRNLAVEKITIVIQANVRRWLAKRLRKRCEEAKPKLQAAIDKRTLAALDEVLAKYSGIGFEIKELARAKRLRFIITEEQRLEAVLSDLMRQDPEKIFEQLERACAEADDIELRSEIANRARKTMNDLRDRKQARLWLVEGIEEADIEKLQWAISTAKRLGLSDSLTAAEEMVRRIEKEQVMVKEMETYMESGGYLKEGDVINASDLRRVVDTATAFVCKTKHGIAIYAKAFVIAKIRDTLKAALGTKDKELWRACGEAVQLAIDDLKSHPEVEKAADEVAHQAAVDEVAEKLTMYVRELDQEGITFNLGQAERLRIDEIKYPIVPSARDYLARIIEAKRLMDDAVNAVDEVKLMYAVQYAESFGYEKPQTQHARQLRDYVITLVNDINYAMDIFEEEPMKEIVNRADSIRFTNPDLEEIRRWAFQTSEEKFVQEQLKKTIKLKDEPRQIRLTIRLKEIFFRKAGEMFNFEKFGRLLQPIDWANKKLITMNREKLAMSMRHHTLDVIHTSLTENNEEPKIDAKRADAAKKLFKNLLGIMGDRNYGQPGPLIQDCLTQCLADPWLRDEMYCQVVKQLTDNPNIESERKGFQFLAVLLEQFPPNKELENHLGMWLKKFAKPTDRYTRLFHLAVYAGPRQQVLNDIEVQNVMSGKALRDINFDTVRPYQPPPPEVPPVGQAQAYYQQYVLKNEQKVQQKQLEMQQQQQKLHELGGTAVVQQQMVSKPAVEETAPPPPPPSMGATQEAKPLPPNWAIAYTDDNEIYYYNTVTNESSWDRPE